MKRQRVGDRVRGQWVGSTRQVRRNGSSMVNFRDLGGLPTDTGARTGYGVLYRGDAPCHDDVPPAGRSGWPPALVLDLREPDEPIDGHPLAGPDTRVVQVPLLAGPHIGDWRALPSLHELYRGSLSRAGERIAEVLELLISTPGPALVHCAAGKDRTGVLVAVLLRAAGVCSQAVLADYLRTERNVPALVAQLAWDTSGFDEEDRLRAQHLVGTSATALQTVLDELEAAPGGVLGWLHDHDVPASALQAWTLRLLS